MRVKILIIALFILSLSLWVATIWTPLSEKFAFAKVFQFDQERGGVDFENTLSESGADILKVIDETRTLLKQKELSHNELVRAQKRLDIAVDEFYKKHLRTIAVSLARKDTKGFYKKGFEEFITTDIKAESSPRYRDILEKRLKEEWSINITGNLFRSYVYIVGQTNNQTHTPGSLPKETMALMVKAEKWGVLDEKYLLKENDLKRVFQETNFFPWNINDIKTMRKAIVTEGYSSQTLYTKAYLTALKTFSHSQKSNRLYLKESLNHKKQEQWLSCEANSLTDFLNFYRVRSGLSRVSENEIFSLIPKDERLPDLIKENGKFIRIWWDPDKAFIWKANGKQSININELSGYGIHAPWVLPVLEKLISPIELRFEIMEIIQFNILWSLYSGDPILFWYVLSDSPKSWFTKLEWKTFDGEMRTGYIGEHTGVIVGAEVSKTGDLLRLAYYEWTQEAVHWEKAEDLLRKARYFNTGIFVKR